jgi:hypothetical protein
VDAEGGKSPSAQIQFSEICGDRHAIKIPATAKANWKRISHNGSKRLEELPYSGYAHNLQASPIEGSARMYTSSPDSTSDSRCSSAAGAGARSLLAKRPVLFRGWLCGVTWHGVWSYLRVQQTHYFVIWGLRRSPKVAEEHRRPEGVVPHTI